MLGLFPFPKGPSTAASSISNRGPSTSIRPTPNSPQVPSRHLTVAAPSTASIAIPMASIIIRQDPGSIYRPGRTNIGYSIASEDSKIGEPGSQVDDDSWMEFLTDEAIEDLTLPDQDPGIEVDGLASSDARPDASEEVIDLVEEVSLEDEVDVENQKDEGRESIAIRFRTVTPSFLASRSCNIDLQVQGPPSLMLMDGIPRDSTLDSFRGFYDTMGNPVFQRDYDYEPALPPHLRRPIFVDWAEPFKSPVYALRYLAEIAGDYYTVALTNQRINMQQRPQTPGAQSALQSHLLSPAASHIATPTRTPARKRLRFCDDVVRTS
ncbi:hypothetical protein CaCOL14_009463 [Colletotrichum acutatum]